MKNDTDRSLIEFKESDPWDYKAPKGKTEIIGLDDRRFAWISGQGDPNSEAFSQALAALYGLSYALRMSYRQSEPPPGAGSYTVGALQGLWSVEPGTESYDGTNKQDLAWQVMIRQPDFLNPELFAAMTDSARAKARKKGVAGLEWYDRLEYGMRDGGLYAQTLHQGPYDDEPETFSRMDGDLAAMGYRRTGKDHREIYLSDPQRTAPEKLRTILRVAVEQI